VERKARCCCGKLSISVAGQPRQVFACSCHYCQRRTGATMQQSAWFSESQVDSITGDSSTYAPNPNVVYHFCSTCGSTVYWEMPRIGEAYGETLLGISVGSFADSEFPEPQVECWSSKRHKWLRAVGSERVFEQGLEELPELH